MPESTEWTKRFRDDLKRVYIEVKDITKYKMGEFRCGEDGPSYLRSKLSPEFRNVSLTEIRNAIHYLSGDPECKRSSRKPRKKSRYERVMQYASKHELERDKNFSPQYIEYIESDAWRQRALQHKRDVDYRCQMCSRFLTGNLLEVHHHDYSCVANHEDWGTEHWKDLLCCCKWCHKVAHLLRDSTKDDIEQLDLFS